MADVAKLGFEVETAQLEKAVASLNNISTASKTAGNSTKQIGTSMTEAAKAFAGAVAGMNKGILSFVEAQKTSTTEQIAAAKEASEFATKIYEIAAAEEKLSTSTDKATNRLQKMYSMMLKAASNESLLDTINRTTGVTGLGDKPARLSFKDFSDQMTASEWREATGDSRSNRGHTEAQQLSRFNTSNIAAQFQDIAVTANMGMNPMTIALQQGTQLVGVLSLMDSPLKAIGEGLKSLISPLSLVTVGLVALVAAGIEMVNWSETTATVLDGVASAMEFVANNSDVFTAALLSTVAAWALLNAGTIATTLQSWGSAFLGLIPKITKLIASLGQLTIAWIASNPYTLLAAGFAAVTTLFVAFSDEIDSYFGVDFTGVVKSAINSMIGLFVGAVEEVYALFKWLWDKTKELFGGDDVNKGLLDTLGDTMNNAMNRDYLGGISSGLSTAASAVSNKLSEWSTALRSNSDEMANAESEAEKLKQAWDDLLTSATNNIDKLKLQQSLIGAGTYETTYKETMYDLQNKAESEGITLDESKIEKLKELAQETASLTTEIEKQTEMYDFAKSTTKSFFTDLRQDLANGASAWEAFGDAVSNVLDKVLDKMISIGVDSLFDGVKASGFSWSSLFSSSATTTDAASSAASVSVAAAKGGSFSNGVYSSPTVFAFAKGDKFGVMGEAGPEAVMPLTRSPDGSLGVRASGLSGSNDNNVVVNVINNSSAQATTTKRETSQGTEIDVLIDQTVAEKMNTNGTASNYALKSFNNRQLIAR